MKTTNPFALALIAAGIALTSCQKENVAPETIGATATANVIAEVSNTTATVVDDKIVNNKIIPGFIKINYTLNTAASRPNVIVELKSVGSDGQPDGKYSRSTSNTRTATGTYSETFAGLKVGPATIPAPPAGAYVAKIYFNSNSSTAKAVVAPIVKR